MSERATRGDREGRPVNWEATGDGVRVYEEGNPDAWVEATFEAGVAPEKRLFAVCPDCGLVAPQRSPPGRGAVCGACGAEADSE